MDEGTLIAESLENGEAIDRAIDLAVRERLLEHKRRGERIVVWRDGKVVWLNADEIDVPPLDAQDAAPTAAERDAPAPARVP